MFRHSRHGPHTNEDLTHVFNELKLANAQENQISRHLRCLLEGYLSPPVSQALLLNYRPVRYGNQSFIDDHLNIKGRLLAWMVKARKRPSGIALFKLCHCAVFLLSSSAVPAPVETNHPIIYLSNVGDFQNYPSRNLLWEADPHLPFPGIPVKRALYKLTLHTDLTSPEGQLYCIQCDLLDRRWGLNQNFSASREFHDPQIRF